mgnify:CR=1 FL=1
MHKLLRTALLVLVASIVLIGCDSDSDSGGGSAKFTGTWALTQGAGISWYILFNADGTWLISDTADGSARRDYGTYAVSVAVATGPMTNPGVGEGEIVATIDGDTLSLDFIEHWHNPYKHVPYTGTKI